MSEHPNFVARVSTIQPPAHMPPLTRSFTVMGNLAAARHGDLSSAHGQSGQAEHIRLADENPVSAVERYMQRLQNKTTRHLGA